MMIMKKIGKGILLSLLMCLLLTAAAVPARAGFGGAEVFASDTVSGEYDSSLFAAGETVSSGANVNGVLLAAGNTVKVDGGSDYVLAAGRNVLLGELTRNDAFLAGYDVSVTGGVERDVFAAGNIIRVSGSVGRSLYATGSTVHINGEIGGNVYIDAEKILIDNDASIGGTLRYNSGAEISAPASVLAKAETYAGTESAAPEAGESFGYQLLDRVLSGVGVAAIALLLLLITPLWETLDRKYVGAPFAEYAKAFGIGFAVLAAVPLAAILLMISRVGLRLSFILLLLYIAAIMAAPVFLSFFLGALLWREAMKKAPCYWAELLLGVLLWRVAASVPVASFAVGLVTVPLGVGVLTLLLGKRRNRDTRFSQMLDAGTGDGV